MWRTLNLSALIILFSLTASGQQPRIESFEGRDVVSGEVLVRFRNTGGPQAMTLASQDTDIMSSEQVGRSGAVRLRSRGRNVGSLVRAYRQRFDILYAEPNYILRATDFPNDEFAARQWALKNTGQDIEGQTGTAGADIGVEAAWNITEGSRSIVVGVLDSGIDYNHPDLAANIWSAPAAFSVTIGGQVINCAAGTHGFDAIKRTCDPIDVQDGHGTHVAGIIGAAGNNGLGISGVSRLSSIMALKFLRPEGFGTTADAIAALEFAIQVKAIFPATADIRVLNNSWGYSSLSQALLDQVSLTEASNMLFVASAGNDALNNDLTPHYPGNFKVPNVVAVAALDNQDRLADFSNWGPTTVHLGAPGVGILSTVPQGPLKYNEGTSMAAPMVAGAAALVLSACPLSTAELKAALLDGVYPVLALAGRTVSGGRLDVFRALSGCIGTTAGFGLTVSPGTRQLELMQASSFDITVIGINGFSAPVDLSLLNVPNGMTATLTSSSILGGSGSSTLTLTPSNTVEAGLYLIGVRGTGGGLERVSGVAVTVGFPIAPGETISGELSLHDAPSPEEPGKYGDLFKLTLASTTDVTIDLKSRIFDGFLYLRSNTGEILLSDNDSGTHHNSRIQASLASGTYSIEVTSIDPGNLGRYTLSINTPTLADVFPYAAATASSVTVTFQGARFISPLTVEAGSGITVSNVSVASPTLASATLTVSPDAITNPRELTVRTSEGVSNPLTFTLPPVINVGERISGALSDTDQILVNRAPYRYADIYRLNLAASTTLDIDLLSEDFDAYLFLLSSSGDILLENDDGGAFVDARINTTLAAGTYFIEVTSNEKLERGDYAVSVNVPTLDSITPHFLPAGAAITTMSLTGTRFSGGATVDAGSGITVSNISITSPTTMTARFTVSAAATPGVRNVKVTTSEGTTNSVPFRVTPVIPLISAGGTVFGSLSSTDPESMVIAGSRADLYRIAGTSPLAIHLVTTGFEGHLRLLSSSGAVLAESADPENTGSIEIVGTFAGASYIEVTSPDPGATGSYTLKLNTILITSITPSFGFHGTTVELFYSGRFSAAPASIDAGPGISATFLSFTLSPGGVTSGSVRLVISAAAPLGPRQIKFTSAAGTDIVTFDVLPALPALAVGQEVSGALSGADQPSLTDRTTYGDFYRLTVAGTVAVVELSSTEFEVSLTELSLNGTVINQSTGPTARLVNLTAGDHILQVTSRSPAVGGYRLSVPAPPTLTAITPNGGIRGTTLGVVLTGTSFSTPMSIISVPNHVTFTNVNVYSPTRATAVATIRPFEIFPCGGFGCVFDPVGVKDVSVVTNTGTSSARQFTVVASGVEPIPASRLSFARFFAPADLAGTGIALVNPAPVAADVQFWMYNTSGSRVGFYTETVGPRSQMARLGSELFPAATEAGRIEVTSTTTGLQGFWFGGDFTNVMDGTESAPKAHDLIFPLVTPKTELTLAGSTATSATVRIYDGQGAEMGTVLELIPANGGVQRSLGLLFTSVDLGSAKYIRVTAGAAIMGTTVIKDSPVDPSWVVLNGIDASVLSTEANFPHVPSGGGWVSVAGITNLSTSPQAVTFTYYPKSGNSVSVIRFLAGRGSIRESADDLFGFGGATQDGWVNVTGTLPLTGYIAYGYAPTGGAAAVPVQATPRTSMIFSHVATGPQFETGLALLNTTSRDANVEVYIMRRTGALVGGAGDVLTASFTLRAGTKVARLLSEFVPASVYDDGFVFVRSTNHVPLYAFQLFFTRDVKVIANVPAGVLSTGVSYSPPSPPNPLPPMTISSLSPPSAPAGTVIAINGSGFDLNAANNAVVFTTATAAVSVVPVAATSTTLIVAIPNTAVTGPVFFTTGGRFSNSVTLTVP